jgi:FkbM family methyltransferase
MISKLRSVIKERIYKRLRIPYSRHGLPLSLLKYLPANKPISLIDIGAHNGSFTHALNEYCGISCGLLIEPLPDKSDKLKEIFNSPEYSVFECVLSDKAGFIDFEVNQAEFTSSILNIKRSIPELSTINLGDAKIIKCEAKTLDELVSTSKITTVNLIKLDVQGAEHLVINGAINTLKITNMVWTEVSFKPLYENSSVFSDIYYLFEKIGFRLTEIEPGFRSPSGELLQADCLFTRK